MELITIVTIGFLVLEAFNVLALYFFPDTTYANSIGIFKAWEKSKRDPEIHDFVKYLVNWVAGTKLIFILLLIVILLIADDRTLIFAVYSLVVSVASFFWRLFPLVRKMDREGQIQPKNYSLALGWMIAGFLVVFSAAAAYSFLK
ncbi:MAG: hypothetical protein P8046_06865 [Anaerolineales bacterium]